MVNSSRPAIRRTGPLLAVVRWVARAAEGALRPTVTIAGRTISTFQLCGLAGFGAAVAAAFPLGARLGLSLALLAVLAAAAAGTFLVVVLVTRAILGEERLVYYHHELAVLAVAALTLAALGRPVLVHLDVAIVALGVFLACGRIGCAMVGCCHGRPHRLRLGGAGQLRRLRVGPRAGAEGSQEMRRQAVPPLDAHLEVRARGERSVRDQLDPVEVAAAGVPSARSDHLAVGRLDEEGAAHAENVCGHVGARKRDPDPAVGGRRVLGQRKDRKRSGAAGTRRGSAGRH